MASNNSLPPKENALFKRILKCYEQKQYKNGLKFAKQILSNPKFSEHGETLAMKGLTLSCLGKKDEAYEFVRRGLRNSLKSHVCWHAYGLLQRADRKYDEAIKCYRNALKWDKDNLQILRDLSLLQIQMRDLEGYKETRYQLLVLRPGQKVSWIGYAMAFHLLKDYDMALEILEEFRKTQNAKPFDYEHSEMLLYQNSVMIEAGQYKQALQHISQYASQTVDKLWVQETKADLFLKLGNYTESELLYKDLLERNPENVAYYKGLEGSRQPATLDERVQIYRSSVERFPKALTPKKMLLELLQGEDFKSEVDKFLTTCLRKGVPPLFKNMRFIYTNHEKVKCIESLMVGYVCSLKEHKLFHPDDQEDMECPTSLLWCFYYLGQHYDHLNQHELALKYIDEALEHTMTLIELYLVKAKIYKHAGDIMNAVKCLDEAQSLDTADRYVNSKCTKYMLRAGLLKEAQDMCSKFTREGISAMENLHEMQCMWFEIECALYYKHKCQFGEALKKCHEIDRHFSEIIEDQFDFHTYCMRKMTLRSYVQLLRLEDQLRSHKFYFKAAYIAIEIYLHLHDHPLSDVDANETNHVDNLTPAERKKLKNKQRKKEMQAAKKEKQEQQQKQQQLQQQQNAKLKNDEIDGPKEEELKPDKLARPENALEEATKFLKPLQIFTPNNIQTQILAFRVYQKKGKYLLMLQAVKRGWKINRNNPQIHECVIQFLHAVSQEASSLPEQVRQVLKVESEKTFGKLSANELNENFIRANSNSLSHLLAGSKMRCFLNPDKKEDSLNHLLSNHVPGNEKCTVEECQAVFASLSLGDFGNCENETKQYMEKCHKVYIHAKAFYSCNNNPAERSVLTATTDVVENGVHTDDNGHH
ncbi:hypothetical protein HELRODRAFT_112750 [Helobdella robusta]|uniref:N-alpha-acetyltransferase 15, NatA auxiliary subunit n=1 Tax=Helobdella robusta TaxID=6412 RepID=T1EFL9_HELRO|nr:hypothetical protein HELRODRAFT_112750 [Helobdella robusta]ESO01348.1 hypothetical protein HELRODRAFT_112750 [Helobdella robusta]